MPSTVLANAQLAPGSEPQTLKHNAESDTIGLLSQSIICMTANDALRLSMHHMIVNTCIDQHY